MFIVLKQRDADHLKRVGTIPKSLDTIIISEINERDLSDDNSPQNRNNNTIVVLRIDDHYIKQCVSIVSDIIRLGLHYVVVVSESELKCDMIRIKARALFYNVDDDPETYLLIASTLIDAQCVPVFGHYRSPNICPAGILPLVLHNGGMYCLFGIDNGRRVYSDFGGGYDTVYSQHKTDSYKNVILGDRQIMDGNICDEILFDHYLSTSNTDSTAFQISELEKNSFDKDLDKKTEKVNHRPFREYPRSTLGYGDPNTKYTAFREFMEETSYLNEDKRICYVFNPDVIFRKLYRTSSYMYLGGDKTYGYDMYVVLLTTNDLGDGLKQWFLERLKQYEENPGAYVQDCIRTINGLHIDQKYFKIPQNREMIGVEMIPIQTITNHTTKINYVNYVRTKKNSDNQYGKRETRGKKMTTYHKDLYGSEILDAMRPCFADAMVRYSCELDFVGRYYETVKPLLRID